MDEPKSETDPLIQQSDNSAKPAKKNLQKKHAVVIPVLAVTFLGGEIFNVLITEFTQYKIRHEMFPNSTDVKQFSACDATNQSDPIYQQYKTVQQTTATWSLYYKLATNIPTLFMNLILPTYTDSYGRRFLFILATAGMFIKAVGVTIVVYLNQHLTYIVAASVIEGLCGSVYAIFCTTFSYVADITVPNNNRVLGILIIDVTVMSSATIAGALTGVMVEAPSLGYKYTSTIAAAMIGAGLISTITFLPETLQKHENSSKTASVLGTVKKTVEFYISKDFKGMRAKYIVLLLSFYFATMTMMNRSTMETIFLLGQPICWGPAQIGYYSLTQNVCRGFIGLVSVKLFQRCTSSEVIGIISTVSTIAAFIIEGFATTDIMMYCVAVAGVFSSLVTPMIRGMMSTITPPDRQGAMFASVSTVDVFSSLTGSLLMNEIYSATLSIMNGFVFLVLAGVTLIDFSLLVSNYFMKVQNQTVWLERV